MTSSAPLAHRTLLAAWLLALTLLVAGCGTGVPNPAVEVLRPDPGEGLGYTEIYLLPADASIQIDNTLYATAPAAAGAWLKGYLPIGRHTVAVSAPGFVTRYRDIEVTEDGGAGAMMYLCRRGVNSLVCRD